MQLTLPHFTLSGQRSAAGERATMRDLPPHRVTAEEQVLDKWTGNNESRACTLIGFTTHSLSGHIRREPAEPTLQRPRTRTRRQGATHYVCLIVGIEGGDDGCSASGAATEKVERCLAACDAPCAGRIAAMCSRRAGQRRQLPRCSGAQSYAGRNLSADSLRWLPTEFWPPYTWAMRLSNGGGDQTGGGDGRAGDNDSSKRRRRKAGGGGANDSGGGGAMVEIGMLTPMAASMVTIIGTKTSQVVAIARGIDVGRALLG